MTKNQILVQDIESFATITRLTVDVESGETVTDRVDQYFTKNANWGIVSLDDDADGEYMAVLLVAPVDGPDFVMDTVTGEMEPVEDIDPAAELAAKMDIALEMDMNDVPQEQIVAMIASDDVPAKTITRLLRGPAAMMGIIKEVKIVDQMDCIVFLARDGNVVFPPQNNSQK